MISNTRSNLENEVVVAYFANSLDAQRAIDDLLSEGFEPRQMGAAFRSGIAASPVTETGEIGSKTVRSAIDSDTVGSGPASDTRAVTPAGLSTGSGSVISGAGRPGPIPGSDIPHHRSTAPLKTSATVTNPLPATGGLHETHEERQLVAKVEKSLQQRRRSGRPKKRHRQRHKHELRHRRRTPGDLPG